MPLDQATEIQVAGAAGFDFVELRVPKIAQFLKTATLDELSKMLAAQRLNVVSINALERVNTRGPGKEKELSDECSKSTSWAERLACPYIVTVPGFLPSPKREADVIEDTVACLAPLAEIAAAHKVRLGFEFLGFSNCSVNSLRMARRVVDQLARRDVGLVIDSFHFFLSGEPLEQLPELRPSQLLLFHVNDAEGLPRADLRDEHRVMPGRGVIPLRKMWETLRRYELIDHASIELFRPEYWELPPERLLREALDSMRAIFS